MNRNAFIAIVLSVLVLLGAVGLWWYLTSSTPSGEPGIATNPFPNSRTPIGTTASPTQSSLKDILKDPETKSDPVNPGHYYIGVAPDATVDAPVDAPFIIEYIASTKFYNIALLREPLREVRSQAEQYLMERLGATQDDMCELSYMVSVSGSVSSAYTSTSLGFSFCPGAVQLP